MAYALLIPIAAYHSPSTSRGRSNSGNLAPAGSEYVASPAVQADHPQEPGFAAEGRGVSVAGSVLIIPRVAQSESGTVVHWTPYGLQTLFYWSGCVPFIDVTYCTKMRLVQVPLNCQYTQRPAVGWVIPCTCSYHSRTIYLMTGLLIAAQISMWRGSDGDTG
ncbi:hypothetical protein SCAR479_07624 [Seiridium cardinale]|uniref:Uncharacterized protein n=1 Tax=Seiridium cardinale TaxID=138064 RepID=A0ABR2XPU4_9PEZI